MSTGPTQALDSHPYASQRRLRNAWRAVTSLMNSESASSNSKPSRKFFTVLLHASAEGMSTNGLHWGSELTSRLQFRKVIPSIRSIPSQQQAAGGFVSFYTNIAQTQEVQKVCHSFYITALFLCLVSHLILCGRTAPSQFAVLRPERQCVGYIRD